MSPLIEAKSGDIIIHHPIARCDYHESVADELMVNQIIDYYVDTLACSDKAQAYLKNRGFLDLDLLSEFRIGYADRSLGLRLAELDRYQEESARGALQRSGLLKGTGHELFRGSLIFPFIDQNGNIHGGYGRRITPKLKASSAYHVHWLAEPVCFFNQQALMDNRKIILCKSPIESLTWWYFGFKNTVSLMGYASFTPQHLQILNQSKVNQVFVAFGSSKAEFEAALKIACSLTQVDIEPLFIFYPGSQDANGFSLASSSPKEGLSGLLAFAFVPCSRLNKQEVDHGY